MRAELVRHAYLPECTLGWLHYNGLRLATIERPWIMARDHKGGQVRESCVPDGTYVLRRHNSERWPDTFALVNADLDVHHMPTGHGRSAILIHAGNRVRDVVGCIAVGLSAGRLEGEPAVMASQQAMRQLRDAFAPGLPELVIRPVQGTEEVTWHS